MQLDIHISWFDCEICFYMGESCRNALQVRNLELQNAKIKSWGLQLMSQGCGLALSAGGG